MTRSIGYVAANLYILFPFNGRWKPFAARNKNNNTRWFVFRKTIGLCAIIFHSIHRIAVPFLFHTFIIFPFHVFQPMREHFFIVFNFPIFFFYLINLMTVQWQTVSDDLHRSDLHFVRKNLWFSVFHVFSDHFLCVLRTLSWFIIITKSVNFQSHRKLSVFFVNKFFLCIFVLYR